jgi:hypothetical protein
MATACRARPLPPILRDTVTQVPSLVPPLAEGPYDGDGTFVYDALNVYANAPVDVDIVNAVPIGSAGTIRFFVDQQRTSPGSFPNLDWPALLGEHPVAADGSVRADAPANVSMFEQLRSADGTVPVNRAPDRELGAAHVAGMNFGRPGTTVRCVGCHIGHTMIPVPVSSLDAQWTNLATGAAVVVSSTRDANSNRGLIDRSVLKSEICRYCVSANNQFTNQWVRLEFPAPIQVRTVRLYNPRQGDEANSSVQVQSTTVQLCADTACNTVVAAGDSGVVTVSGTNVPFADVAARAVRVNITGVTGTFYGARVASLAEIEVIARGGSGGISSPPRPPAAPTTLRSEKHRRFCGSGAGRLGFGRCDQLAMTVDRISRTDRASAGASRTSRFKRCRPWHRSARATDNKPSALFKGCTSGPFPCPRSPRQLRIRLISRPKRT